MNAREWSALTGADAGWRRRAGVLTGELEAVFDDAGRAGLAWRTGGVRHWAWLGEKGAPGTDQGLTRAPGPAAPVPELAGMLQDFSGLHPVAETLSGPERLELRLAEPAPWPLFARCDLAKPFAARPAYWAKRLGGRGVAAVALAAGRMEIFVV